MAQERSSEQADRKQPEIPLLCTNNCGFFGCPTTKNLCSKCYKALVLIKEESRRSVKALGGEKRGVVLPALSEETLTCTDAIFSASTSGLLPSDTHSPACISLLPVTCSTTPATYAIAKRAKLISKEQQPATDAPQRGSTSRCLSCLKRVGLLGFKCRCGGVFCSTHRYSDTHACTFDYKFAGRDAIAKANPLVKADKLERI